MVLDSDRFWQAMEAADHRFDGWVYCGVTSTGIYCRPSCPARTPKRENVRFYPTAAAAQAAGFRACKRCRPDATPGSPEWDRRADLIGRAMRLIADGVVDREGVRGLASRLGYTERHVHRALSAAVGAGPLALARAQRAQTARALLETTSTPITQVAYAAGFNSVRQFNATVKDVFAMTPGQLRARGETAAPQPSDAVVLRLPYRSPIDGHSLIGFLGMRAVAGIEEADAMSYRRTVRLPHGNGIIELKTADGYIRACFWLDDLRDLATAMQRCRILLDLDSDPESVTDALRLDAVIGHTVLAHPGVRVPGHLDNDELAVRAVLGQQVSLRHAARLAAGLVAVHGEPLERPLGTMTHLFPTMDALAEADLGTAGLPKSRANAIRALAGALAANQLTLDAGADREAARRQLLEIPGIGVWTVDYIAMRALRDPDAFPATDLGVRHALRNLGYDGTSTRIEQLAEQWRPYRAYAVQHLWRALADARRASSPHQPAAA